MSEATTSTAAPSAAPTATPSQAPAPAGAQGSAPSPQSTQPQGQQQTVQERILGDSDLDAFIEHTVNGKKEKIKVRDALKHYGLEKSATQKAMEAARIQKQQQQLAHWFNNDPDKFFEATGVNRDEWLKRALGSRKEIAEEILAQEYERQQMSPEARKALELEEQLKQFQARESELKRPILEQIKKIVPERMLPKGLENATYQQLQQYHQVKQQEFQSGIDNLSQELLGAWEKQGLPKQKEFGQWMAQVMRDHEKRTGQPLHPEQAAARVKTRFLESTRSLLSQMDAKAIQETLGDEILQKLRAYDVDQVRASAAPQFQTASTGPANPATSEKKKTMDQFEFRKWAGIG